MNDQLGYDGGGSSRLGHLGLHFLGLLHQLGHVAQSFEHLVVLLEGVVVIQKIVIFRHFGQDLRFRRGCE